MTMMVMGLWSSFQGECSIKDSLSSSSSSSSSSLLGESCVVVSDMEKQQGGWLFWLLWSPSLVALIYAFSVHCFLAGWHERKWTDEVFPQLTNHVIWFALTNVLLLLFLADDDGRNNVITIMMVVLGVVNWIVSLRFLIKTHEEQVQGPKPPTTNNDNNHNNSLEGKVYLITGANAGIGKETAIQLWKEGATIILACRSKRRVEEAGFDVTSPNSRYLFLPCDLSSLSSVRNAVTELKESLKITTLHGLINNAGVMLGKQSFTQEGQFDTMMACNHIGHFLLTQLLLPILLDDTNHNNHDPRIVILTSCTYTLAKHGMNWNDLHCNKNIVPYTLFGQYAQTKLANILFAQELARRYPSSIRVALVHPGLVRTNVTANMPWYLRYPNAAFSLFLMVLQKTPPAGAYTTVYCLTSPHIPRDGQALYYVNSQPKPLAHPHAHTPEEAKKLWDISCEWVGLSNDENETHKSVKNYNSISES